MRKGTVFCEIFSSNWVFPYNRKICEHIGINYLEDIGCQTDLSDWIDGIKADYTVDELSVKEMICRAEKVLRVMQ